MTVNELTDQVTNHCITFIFEDTGDKYRVTYTYGFKLKRVRG